MIVRETGVAWPWFVLQVTDAIVGFGNRHVKAAACAMVIDVLCIAMAFYVYKLTTGKYIKHAQYRESTAHMFAYIAEMSTKMLFDELMMPSFPETKGTGSAGGQQPRRHSLRRYSIHSTHTTPRGSIRGSVKGSEHFSQAVSHDSGRMAPGRMAALQRPNPLHSTVSHISGSCIGPRRPSGGATKTLGGIGGVRASTGIRSPGLHANIKLKQMNVQNAAMKWKSRKVFKPMVVKQASQPDAPPAKPQLPSPTPDVVEPSKPDTTLQE